MLKVVVGSTNPVKVNATSEAFKSMFPDEEFEVQGVSVVSGVSDQPSSEDETIKGSENRMDNACTSFPDADYWVGHEGGIEYRGDQVLAFAWITIRSKVDDIVGRGRTASYFLPKKVVDLINQGKELAHANDEVFGLENSKHKGGGVGILTNDVIDRTKLYSQAVVLALIPFLKREIY